MPNKFVVCDGAIMAQLESLRANKNIGTINLYKSTMTPAHSSVIASFDAVKADFTGYGSGQTPAYAVPVLAANRATMTGAALSWIKNGATANTIYGYYADEAPVLGGAEQLSSTVPMTTNGDTMTIQPVASMVDAAFLNPASSTLVVANEILANYMDMLIQLNGPLNGCLMHLFKGDITPSRGDTAATYAASGVQADFTGYTEVPITWGTHVLVGDQRRMPSQSIVWTKNGATGNTIYGYYILDGYGALVGAKRYDATAAMTANGQQHTAQMVYTIESEL